MISWPKTENVPSLHRRKLLSASKTLCDRGCFDVSTDKIRKYVLPYLPYAAMFWFFAKCAEAYRLSPDGEVIHRLMGAMTNLSAEMANPLPSLYLFDLCVGLIGAATIYGIVWKSC